MLALFHHTLKEIRRTAYLALLACLMTMSPFFKAEAQDILEDGDFAVQMNGSVQVVSAGGWIGKWKVDSGSVELVKNGSVLFQDKDYPGVAVDLAGNGPGSISQILETRIHHEYTLDLAYAGNFNKPKEEEKGKGKGKEKSKGKDKGKETRVMVIQIGGESRTIRVDESKGWSPREMQWKRVSFSFKATSAETKLEIKSQQDANSTEGMFITDLKVVGSPPPSLSSVKVPLPSNLDQFIKNREKAILLGKALFWDIQVGSDGRTSCATCHNHAGIDQRTVNTVHPGAPGSSFGPQLPGQEKLSAEAIGKFRGANKRLVASDFPFHKVANPIGDHESNKVARDTMEVVGSQGVIKKDFQKIIEGNPIDQGKSVADPVFQVGGVNARQVTGRNSPTTINSVFFDRLFWDGRANHYFNGVNPFGDLDPNARVLQRSQETTSKTVWVWKAYEFWGYMYWILTPCVETETIETHQSVKIRLNNAALASQAVGPPLSGVEMSWDNRQFKDLGRKMLSLKPLALQKVHNNDSVLGSHADISGTGLRNVTYAQLIRESFQDTWWSSPIRTSDDYTHMESNFSLYWGLALMMYESTLVSDQTPYDSYASGNSNALSKEAKRGLEIFMKEGKCINCHGGPEFAGATISDIRSSSSPKLVEKMEMASGTAFYDSGFYNIGVRRTLEDIAVGARHPQFGPLSYTAQRQAGRNIEQNISVPPDARIAVNGAFKTPTLRNIELTGPYFHNGGARTLREAVEFYVRGSDFHKENKQDLDPDVDGISELQGNPKSIDDLVRFLESLTDERVRLQKAPFDHPELPIPNGHSNLNNGIAVDNVLVLPAVGKDGGPKVLRFEDIVK